MKLAQHTAEVQDGAARAVAAREALWEAGEARRVRWLVEAFEALADPTRAEHAALVDRMAHASGLSHPMTRWALDSTLRSLTRASLTALCDHAVPPSPRAVRARPGRLCAVVLSGNVCTAVARAVAIPLLFGWPVVAKASSRDDVLAIALAEQLARGDADLAEALHVSTFAGDDKDSLHALLAQCDAVSVYGSDQTLQQVRAEVSATATFLGHGHGLGLGLVTQQALAEETLAKHAAHALALDVAAYDQRGCLSPHTVLVQQGGAVAPERFAELLCREGLAPLARDLPRGPLPMAVGGAQLAWRGQALAHGALHEGDGFAVSFEGRQPPRLSPGYRNVQVIAFRDLAQLTRIAAPLGTHLKCIGVAGLDDLSAITEHLPWRVAPRVCAAGTMQTPPGDALSDGVATSEGLVRWVEID